MRNLIGPIIFWVIMLIGLFMIIYPIYYSVKRDGCLWQARIIKVSDQFCSEFVYINAVNVKYRNFIQKQANSITQKEKK